MLPAPFTPNFLNRLEALRLRTRKEFLGSRPRGINLITANERCRPLTVYYIPYKLYINN